MNSLSIYFRDKNVSTTLSPWHNKAPGNSGSQSADKYFYKVHGVETSCSVKTWELQVWLQPVSGMGTHRLRRKKWDVRRENKGKAQGFKKTQEEYLQYTRLTTQIPRPTSHDQRLNLCPRLDWGINPALQRNTFDIHDPLTTTQILVLKTFLWLVPRELRLVSHNFISALIHDRTVFFRLPKKLSGRTRHRFCPGRSHRYTWRLTCFSIIILWV